MRKILLLIVVVNFTFCATQKNNRNTIAHIQNNKTVTDSIKREVNKGLLELKNISFGLQKNNFTKRLKK